jgi:acetyl-CoA acetyltransferase
VLALQLDPYVTAPLWPDSVSVAALQARFALDAGLFTERDMAEVAARSRADAAGNPYAQVSGHATAEELLGAPYLADPLRAHDCPPVSDGAAAVVLAAGHRAHRHHDRPAWITGLAHRIDPQGLGERDLTTVPSATAAAADAGLAGDLDVAELHAPFSHQELLLRAALGLPEPVRINPSGGVLCGNPMFSAGLSRIGAAAAEVMSGRAERAAGHATSGPALQQNLICVLEAES